MKLLFIFLISCPIYSQSAETVLQRLNKTFAPASQLLGNYQQERFVKHLAVTLNSSGKFSMKKNGGIKWEQLSPFASALNISEKEMSFKVEGSASRIIEREADPILYSFGQAFLSLLKGDDTGLQAQFNIQEDIKKNSWHLLLTPKNDLVKKVIKTISIDGDTFVKSVRIEDRTDNYMKIEFRNIHAGTLSQ